MNTYQTRVDRLRAEMAERGLAALIVTPGAALRYLTGFSEAGYERLLALIVPAGYSAPQFLVPSLHAGQVGQNGAEIDTITLWEDAHGWQEPLAAMLAGLALGEGAVAVDDDMPARFSLPLAGMLPWNPLTLAGPLLTSLRATKDIQEQGAMRRAAAATDALLTPVYAACRPGVTETEVARVIQDGIGRAGHEMSFSPIIGAGKNGALPHHHTGSTPLREGDVVILDLGAKVDGYCGDITRTVALGRADEEARRVYEIVYRAYQAGVTAVQPGATGQDVDAAARRVIAEAGYGPYFIHRTGHGIGLDDHEPPYMVAGNQTPLRPGECFSIEPGIYLPGKFGVRLENIVLVAEDGTAHVLNGAIPPEMPTL